jgi:putative ABC transport system permease protein
LRQSPGFTLTAIVVLALGIGANTATFSVVYAVILRPLPYPDASRLVFVWQRFRGMPAPISERMFVARQNYLEWQRQNTVFQEMGAFHTASLDENSGGFSQKASTYFVSANLFHLLGTQPRGSADCSVRMKSARAATTWPFSAIRTSSAASTAIRRRWARR